MRKLLNNPLFSGALAVVALIAVVLSVYDPSSQRYRPDPADVVEDFEEDLEQSEQPEPATVYDPAKLLALAAKSDLRNIFDVHQEAAPPPTVQPEEQTLTETVQLKGVWIQGDARYAVLNDTLLRPGDRFLRVQVEVIQADGALVTTENASQFLRPGQSWSYHYTAPKTAVPN